MTCRYPFLRNVCLRFEPMLGPGSRAFLSQLLLRNPPKCQCFVPLPWADMGAGLAGPGTGCFQLHLPGWMFCALVS